MGVQQRVCQIRRKNDKAANVFRNAASKESKAVKPIIRVDSECANNHAVMNLCDRVAQLHRQVNRQIAKAKRTLNSIKRAPNAPMPVFNAISRILYNPQLSSLHSFFVSIARKLRPFTNLLNRRISVRVPIPGIAYKRVCVPLAWPCGVKYCRVPYPHWGFLQQRTRNKGWVRRAWRSVKRVARRIKPTIRYKNVPCGPRFCTGRKCTRVPYPTVRMTRFGFTLGQIVRGALNVLSIVKSALMAIVHRLIPGFPMPRIPRIPGLRLPFFRFNVPSFSIRFPRLPSLVGMVVPRRNKCQAVVSIANRLNKAIGGRTHTPGKSTRRPARKSTRRPARKSTRRPAPRRRPARRPRRRPALRDRNRHCPYYARKGYCRRHHYKRICPKSCKPKARRPARRPRRRPARRPRRRSALRDRSRSCPYYARRGLCRHHHYKRVCPKSCKSKARDRSRRCPYYARRGLCRHNHYKRVCPKSCTTFG